jgi:hypothetical protein
MPKMAVTHGAPSGTVISAMATIKSIAMKNATDASTREMMRHKTTASVAPNKPQKRERTLL